MFPVSIDDVHWNRSALLLLLLLMLESLISSELHVLLLLLLLLLLTIAHHPILQYWCGRHCHRRAIGVADRTHGGPHAVWGRAHVVSCHRGGAGGS